MKKKYISPQEEIFDYNTSHSIAQSKQSIDTKTVIHGEIEEEDKLVKGSIWDQEW